MATQFSQESISRSDSVTLRQESCLGHLPPNSQRLKVLLRQGEPMTDHEPAVRPRNRVRAGLWETTRLMSAACWPDLDPLGCGSVHPSDLTAPIPSRESARTVLQAARGDHRAVAALPFLLLLLSSYSSLLKFYFFVSTLFLFSFPYLIYSFLVISVFIIFLVISISCLFFLLILLLLQQSYYFSIYLHSLILLILSLISSLPSCFLLLYYLPISLLYAFCFT
jgi:hypothetical protein